MTPRARAKACHLGARIVRVRCGGVGCSRGLAWEPRGPGRAWFCAARVVGHTISATITLIVTNAVATMSQGTALRTLRPRPGASNTAL